MTINKNWVYGFLFNEETGQAIIETAFLLITVLVIVVVFMSLGYGYYYRNNIHFMSNNVLNILSLEELEDDSSETLADIDTTVLFYKENVLFPIDTNDSDRFSLSWEEEESDSFYTMDTVRIEYEGPPFPFIDTINISVTASALKVEKDEE